MGEETKEQQLKTANAVMVSQLRELRAAAVYLMGESAWDPRTSRSHPWRVTEKAMDRLEAATRAVPVPGGRGQMLGGTSGTNPPPPPPPDRG